MENINKITIPLEVSNNNIIELYKRKLYASYLNAVFPDFNAKEDQITEDLILEIDKFHSEISRCMRAIQTLEEAYKELFFNVLGGYFKNLLTKIYELANTPKREEAVRQFERLFTQATSLITTGNNFRAKACFNAAKVKWKSHLYGKLQGLF